MSCALRSCRTQIIQRALAKNVFRKRSAKSVGTESMLGSIMQTWNYLMQSMDYRHYPVGLNKGNAVKNAEGIYTIYLSHKPMGVDNWISTAGYEEAIIFCRWLLSEEVPDKPVVTLHSL